MPSRERVQQHIRILMNNTSGRPSQLDRSLIRPWFSFSSHAPTPLKYQGIKSIIEQVSEVSSIFSLP